MSDDFLHDVKRLMREKWDVESRSTTSAFQARGSAAEIIKYVDRVGWHGQHFDVKVCRLIARPEAVSSHGHDIVQGFRTANLVNLRQETTL